MFFPPFSGGGGAVDSEDELDDLAPTDDTESLLSSRQPLQHHHQHRSSRSERNYSILMLIGARKTYIFFDNASTSVFETYLGKLYLAKDQYVSMF